MLPILGITMGDTNGIGPEILAKALARPEWRHVCRPVIYGSLAIWDELRRTFTDAPCGVPINRLEALDEVQRDCVPVLHGEQEAAPYKPGTLSPQAGACAIEWLKAAVHDAVAGRIDGIVTCPINKEGVHKAGYTYAGHTDLIAEMTGSPDYRMSLFSSRMRIVHITGHCSLTDAISQVNTARIVKTIQVADGALRRLGTPARRIAVAGLNPHAGEAGAFGREEIDLIMPAIEQCQALGIDCSGPYSPDAVFRHMYDGAYDLVVAMYHDQGHIVFKMVEMDEGVNVTLGIPIVRTSVDHGTAYDLAGKGIAREQSLVTAVDMAARLAAPQAAAKG